MHTVELWDLQGEVSDEKGEAPPHQKEVSDA